jgi:hypothetical protein
MQKNFDEECAPPTEATRSSVRRCAPPVAGTFARWCGGMSDALQGVPDNFGGKGLTVRRGWLLKADGTEEDRARVLGVTYNRKAKDDGTVVNFCPWCGERIRFDEKSGGG